MTNETNATPTEAQKETVFDHLDSFSHEDLIDLFMGRIGDKSVIEMATELQAIYNEEDDDIYSENAESDVL